MADLIKVLIVDDIPETRDHLTKLLGFEADITVVGAASGGREAIALATELQPDVVLMDINMPDMDGIATTEQLAIAVPTASVVMMSIQGEADYLRRSMLAGAREFLVKPFSSDELSASIRQVHVRERNKATRLMLPTAASMPTNSAPPHGKQRGQVVAFFSPKGGVGRTTMAVNAAVVAATELGKKVCLVDSSFQFGDVGVLLNLNPKNMSIADLAPEIQAGGEFDSLNSFIVNHSSGVRVLLAPPSPEMAELITPAGLRQILDLLRLEHDVVFVDCAAGINDSTLAVLDAADIILTVLTLEITSIKNMRLFLGIAEHLGYEEGKVQLVLNRADDNLGIRVADVENSIGRKVDHTIVNDGRSVVYALNRGIPFVLAAKESQVSQDVLTLARVVTGERLEPTVDEVRKSSPRKSLFAWR